MTVALLHVSSASAQRIFASYRQKTVLDVLLKPVVLFASFKDIV